MRRTDPKEEEGRLLLAPRMQAGQREGLEEERVVALAKGTKRQEICKRMLGNKNIQSASKAEGGPALGNRWGL